MMADMFSNKKCNRTVTELFITRRKLKISFVFIKQSYFSAPKHISLTSTYYFIMKIQQKRKI